MFCPKCGHELPDSARFCGSCGASLEGIRGRLEKSESAVDGKVEAAPEAAVEKVVEQAAEAAPEAAADDAPEAVAEQAAEAAPEAVADDATEAVAEQAAETAPEAAEAPGVPVQPATPPVAAAAPAAAMTPDVVTQAAPSVQKTGMSRLAKILIPVACAVVAGIIAAFALGPGTGAKTITATQGSIPTIVASDGTEISALERPSFVKVALTTDASSQESSDGDVAAQDTEADAATQVASESMPTPSVTPYEVDPNLGNIVNLADFTIDQDLLSMVAENGFAVSAGNGTDEFYETYEMNRYEMLPSFVTVDSMMHTYHLYFQHLLKTIEKGDLSSKLTKLSVDMLAASEAQLDELKGTEWESAALRNTAFFAVGASLLDPSTKVSSSVADTVKKELDLISQQNGIADSPTTGRMVDYTQFIVRGYYEGDAQLESYFRAMMWYGTINFTQTVSDTQNNTGIAEDDLDRSAALMTLALAGGPRDNWEAIYATTSFFAGASDDCGFYEYYPILTSVYGEDVSAASLAGDEGAWNRYHELTGKMPAPSINSVPVWDDSADHKEDEKGYRFMGQRFSIDASIMSKLVYNEVGANSSGANRMMPDALDVPAALGSDEALEILKSTGATDFSGYSENMEELRANLTEEAAPALWGASLASQWLYTLNPLLPEKSDGWPTFMQSSAWARKNLQSYLGSYTELKHDTVLYAKQVMVEMGGGMIPEKDDRGYVEPEPLVYRRLADLTEATSNGLSSFGLLSDKDAEDLALLQDLAEKLAVISDKELREEEPSAEEYDLIREFGGNLEHFWQRVHEDEANGASFTAKEYPAALVTDIATDADSGNVLELGIGKASPIYVAVPIDGELHLTKGAVFSFYQFTQPMSERMTDSTWRDAIASGGVSGVADWTRDFQKEWTPSW